MRMFLRIRYLAVPFSSHITSTSSFSSSLDGSKLSHTDWSQAKKVTDDNYSWALGFPLLSSWSNIQIVGAASAALKDFAKGGRCKGFSKTSEKEKQASTFFRVETS